MPMANTYTQIYLHVVFAVAQRTAMIGAARREELQRYMTGVVANLDQTLIANYCMPDHTHMLVGIKPDATLSSLVGKVKSGSTNHINEQRWFGCRFSWQEGFGAFSVSHSHLARVIEYIRNQHAHHHERTFLDEYSTLLKKYRVAYDPRYLFKPVEVAV